jgi:hypothetical protein
MAPVMDLGGPLGLKELPVIEFCLGNYKEEGKFVCWYDSLQDLR